MKKLTIRFHGEAPSPQTLAEAVLQGLARRPRRIPPKFFYDKRGSQLFDAICDLPEYYPTRTEMGILESCATEVAVLVGEDCTLIELGSGATRKIRLLLEFLRPRHYVGVDISREFLQESVQRLAHDYPWLEAHAVCADFTDGFDLPALSGSGPRVLFFPGSTIGNFEPHEALALLQRLRRMAHPAGGLLIGVDLKKDPQILHDAYNDSQEITAAFNLNLLERIRTELGATLDTDGFQHRAFYNAQLGRIEMHLVSRSRQEIRVLGRRFSFDAGESIHTENSYKYSIEQFHALARSAGLRPRRVWTDSEQLFSVHYLDVGTTGHNAIRRSRLSLHDAESFGS
jgi:dimethylhistidine N-methyltransferase